MTVLPSAGYPDFTRPNQWSAIPYINENVTISADKLYAPAFVGGFAGVEVLLLTHDLAVGWQVALAWYADESLVTSLDAATFYAPTPAHVVAFTYNRGPFLQVSVRATSYAVARNYALVVFPRDLPRSSGMIGFAGGQVNYSAVINNGAVRADLGTGAVMGEAILSVATFATKWRARVMGVLANGTDDAVLGALSNGNDTSNSCIVPMNGQTPRVYVTNDDAAPQTFLVGLNVLL